MASIFGVSIYTYYLDFPPPHPPFTLIQRRVTPHSMEGMTKGPLQRYKMRRDKKRDNNDGLTQRRRRKGSPHSSSWGVGVLPPSPDRCVLHPPNPWDIEYKIPFDLPHLFLLCPPCLVSPPSDEH